MNSNEENQLKEENKRLRQELAWIHTLMRNDKVRSDEKVTLYEARYELFHSQLNEEGMARIYVWKIADETGISTDKVGKSLQLLAEHGVIERRMTYITNEKTGQVEKAVYLGLTDVARNPGRIQMPDNKHGGARKKIIRCTSCGHPEHIENRVRICTCCGTKFSDEWRTVTFQEEENTNGE